MRILRSARRRAASALVSVIGPEVDGAVLVAVGVAVGLVLGRAVMAVIVPAPLILFRRPLRARIL